MRYLLFAVVLVMLFCFSAGPAQAQSPTPTPTPLPTQTPVFLYGHQILLPTAWMPPELTRIPVPYTPAPDLNPMGLNITGGRIIAETSNMNRALFDVMGVTGQVLNFIIIAALLLWALFAFLGVIRRAKRIQVTVQGIRANKDEADMIGGNPWLDIAGSYLRGRRTALNQSFKEGVRGLADRSSAFVGRGRGARELRGRSFRELKWGGRDLREQSRELRRQNNKKL